jgi:hypothetical protein
VGNGVFKGFDGKREGRMFILCNFADSDMSQRMRGRSRDRSGSESAIRSLSAALNKPFVKNCRFTVL